MIIMMLEIEKIPKYRLYQLIEYDATEGSAGKVIGEFSPEWLRLKLNEDKMIP